MKKQLITIFVLLFAVAIAYAQDVDSVFTVNGINYRITSISPNEVEVAEHESFAGEVIIPEEVTYLSETYRVTAIGVDAFLECFELTSVSIPNSVKVIKFAAFAYCKALTSVVIPNSVIEIKKMAFVYCSNLTTITIGSSVIIIGEWAFAFQNPSHVYCLPMIAPASTTSGMFPNAKDTKVHICPTAMFYGEEGGYWQNLLIVKDGVCNAGIPQVEEEPLIAIFPNPAANYFTLQIEETHLPQTVQIVNLQGQTVQTLQITNPETKIDVSSLAKGVYFVKTEVGTRKLVVEK